MGTGHYTTQLYKYKLQSLYVIRFVKIYRYKNTKIGKSFHYKIKQYLIKSNPSEKHWDESKKGK